MFALGSFDSLLTLPISTIQLAFDFAGSGTQFSFYQGWTFIHSNWEPVLVPKTIWSTNKWSVISVYWNGWTGPFTAVVFFSLFGLTPKARKTYIRFFRLLGRPFGVRKAESTEEVLPDVVFKSRRRTNATATTNISSRYSLMQLTASKNSLLDWCSVAQADELAWMTIHVNTELYVL